MKKTMTVFALLLIAFTGGAQLKVKDPCGIFTVDILYGTVNTYLIPSSLPEYIMAKLPCATSTEAESATAKCGGGVFYKDRDIYFYTGRDYIEIGPKFKGKLSMAVIGAKRTQLTKWFGVPKLKDTGWEAYTTSYGCMVYYFSKTGVVNKVILSTNSTETLKLCE
jgi:hypothetical protein